MTEEAALVLLIRVCMHQQLEVTGGAQLAGDHRQQSQDKIQYIHWPVTVYLAAKRLLTAMHMVGYSLQGMLRQGQGY